MAREEKRDSKYYYVNLKYHHISFQKFKGSVMFKKKNVKNRGRTGTSLQTQFLVELHRRDVHAQFNTMELITTSRMLQPSIKSRLSRLSSFQVLAHIILFPAYTLDTFVRRFLPVFLYKYVLSKFNDSSSHIFEYRVF